MTAFRDAFGKAGGRGQLIAGDVWLIPDELINFGQDLGERRTRHVVRPILIIQSDDDAENHMCPTVLVMPFSSQVDNKREWEDLISVGETPLNSESIVKVHLLQPISRDRIINDGVYKGSISPEALARIQLHLLGNLGLVDD